MRQIKESAYHFCESFIEERLNRLLKNISSINESLTNETKSSAGDKHETGRAMLHLEREKTGKQLAEAKKTKHLLSKVNIDTHFDKIGLGSLVFTNQNNYFLSISAGEHKTSQLSLFCVSPSTPIGQLLIGKSEGDTIIFNTKEIKIEKVA